MLDLKSLGLNLLNIVTLLTLKFIIGDHPNRLKTISTIFKSKLSKSTLKETGIFLSQFSVHYQSKSISLFIGVFGHVSITILKIMAKKVLMESLSENIPDLEEL